MYSLRGADSSIQVGVLGGLLGKCAAEGEDGLPDPLDNVRRVDVEVGLVRRHGEHAEPAALRGIIRRCAAASATASGSSALGREGICAKRGHRCQVNEPDPKRNVENTGAEAARSDRRRRWAGGRRQRSCPWPRTAGTSGGWNRQT